MLFKKAASLGHKSTKQLCRCTAVTALDGRSIPWKRSLHSLYAVDSLSSFPPIASHTRS